MLKLLNCVSIFFFFFLLCLSLNQVIFYSQYVGGCALGFACRVCKRDACLWILYVFCAAYFGVSNFNFVSFCVSCTFYHVQ